MSSSYVAMLQVARSAGAKHRGIATSCWSTFHSYVPHHHQQNSPPACIHCISQAQPCNSHPGRVLRSPWCCPCSLWCLPHAWAPWKPWAPSESASHPPKMPYRECSRSATRSMPGLNVCKHYQIGGGRSEGTGNVSSDTIFALQKCSLGIPQFQINSFSAWHRGIYCTP